MNISVYFFRSAIEMLEAEIKDSASNLNALEEKSSSEQNLPPAPDCVKKQEFDMVNTQWLVSSLL